MRTLHITAGSEVKPLPPAPFEVDVSEKTTMFLPLADLPPPPSRVTSGNPESVARPIEETEKVRGRLARATKAKLDFAKNATANGTNEENITNLSNEWTAEKDGNK